MIDKKKCIRFKLVYRSSQDPQYNKQNDEERVFQLIEDQKQLQDPDYLKQKEFILKQFNKSEMGLYSKEEALNTDVIPEEIRNQIEEREDLWITHLERFRRQQQQNLQQKKQIQEQEGVEYEEYEELEEVDEQDEYEEYDDNVAKEFFDHCQIKEQLQNENKIQNDFPQNENQLKISFQNNEEYIDISKYEMNPSVKCKIYDEQGIEKDENYSKVCDLIAQHTENEGQQIVFETYVKQIPSLEQDVDYQEKDLTPEQKQILQTLQEVDNGIDEDLNGYEELENNFVELAMGGETILKEKYQQKEILANEKRDFILMPLIQNNDEMTSIIEKKEEVDDTKKQVKKQVRFNIIEEQLKQIKKEKEILSKFEKDIINLDDSKQSQIKQLNEKEFRNILDEHLKEMQTRKKEIQQKKEYTQDQIFQKQILEKINYKEDIAAQQLMNSEEQNNSMEEDKQTDDYIYNHLLKKDDPQQTVQQPQQLSQIDKESVYSFINVVQSKYNKEKLLKLAQNSQKPVKQEENEEKLQDEGIYLERKKNESAEERKNRKLKIKQQKQERKEKKKKFIQEFNQIKKSKQQTKQNSQEGNSQLQNIPLHKIQ